MRKGTYRQKGFRVLSVVLPLCLLALASQAEETPRSAMRKGMKAYRAGDYTNAVSYFKKTALEFPDIGNYNLGNALYRIGDYEGAAKAFKEVLRSPDLKLQANAYYNLGDAYLARTTKLNDPSLAGLAIELAFQAEDMYEKAMLLNPEDLAAKQNFEHARNLRVDLTFGLGKKAFDEAEAQLKEFHAKEAKKNYLAAKKQFEHILNDIRPNENRAKQYLKNTNDRLAMLQRAVEQTQKDLETVIQYIKDYQYFMAAELLAKQSDERKYAFDLKPDLKKKYEEIAKKDTEVLQILKKFSNLNQSK